MRAHWLPVALAVMLVPTAARAQEPAAETSQAPPSQVNLQVLITRWQGDRKIASLPYTLATTTRGRRAWVRHGLQVPLKYEGKETPGNVVYKSLGVGLDCTVDPPSQQRFLVKCNVSLAALHAPAADGKPSVDVLPPLLDNIDLETSFLLRDGQTSTQVSSIDPTTGETVKVEVTLALAK